MNGKLGLASGVGIIVATTVGAGVFVTTGYMAQSMGPGAILLCWASGAAIALAGTAAYAAIAALVPRSGGEYRYLHDLLHPAAGYLAGWASLLVGFSAPVAIDALAAATYARTVVPSLPDPRFTAAALVIAFTLAHAAGLRSSRWTQDALAVVKVLLLAGFVAAGLAFGSNRWPAWQPPAPSAEPLRPFMSGLFYVAFAFSGWNTAVYAAGEFRNPQRDVPRALAIGCGLVALAYLLVNWIFVANLTPQVAQAALGSEAARVTLGHLLMRELLGPGAAQAMSLIGVAVFLSAMSAMTFAGPRVYAEMARDGFLPRAFAGVEGRPPAASMTLQGALALLLVITHELRTMLENVGAVLTLFSALTVLTLFRAARAGRPVSVAARVAAGLYLAAALWMLWFGFRDSPSLILWTVVVAAVALVAYRLTRRKRSETIVGSVGRR